MEHVFAPSAFSADMLKFRNFEQKHSAEAKTYNFWFEILTKFIWLIEIYILPNENFVWNYCCPIRMLWRLFAMKICYRSSIIIMWTTIEWIKLFLKKKNWLLFSHSPKIELTKYINSKINTKRWFNDQQNACYLLEKHPTVAISKISGLLAIHMNATFD